MLRQGERTLSFPTHDPPPPSLEPFKRLRPRPGEYWAVMDPPRDHLSGFWLPSFGNGWDDRNTEKLDEAEAKWLTTQAEALERIRIYEADPSSKQAYVLAQMAAEVALAAHDRWRKMSEAEEPGAGLTTRPDSYTVVAVGEGVDLAPLDRVICAPYLPYRQREVFGVPDVCLIGAAGAWEEITVLRKRVGEDWELVGNWIAAAMYYKQYVVETTRKGFSIHAAKVVRVGPAAESEPGDIVVLHRDRLEQRPGDSRWFTCQFSPMAKDHVVFVREVDDAGERRVLAKMIQQYK